MKLNCHHDYWSKIMKITSIAVFLTTAALSLTHAYVSPGQGVLDERISLNAKDKPLREVLKEIQKQTGANFMYQNNDLNALEKISIVAHRAELKKVLKEILSPLSLSYSVFEKNILIRPAPSRKEEIALPEITVNGEVKAKSTGEPLPGVNILLKGTTRGTTTDADGKFTISVKSEDDVLIFSFIGFKSVEVVVGTATNLSIQLETDILQLQDIVVVGYGSQERETVTGSVSKARVEKVESKSFNTVTEMLQGTVPGVMVQNNGGDPMATPTINIRGNGGLNGDRPLWVVDGVIIGNIDNPQINPNDIASSYVLKDASAAIYGARASGGVIIVTTKKGKAGGLKLTADAKIAFQSPWRKLEPLNAAEFAEVSNIAADNAGLARKDAFNASIYPDGQITRTNWMDEIFRTGKTREYNLGFSGGNEKSTFFTSLGYRRNEGILLNTDVERYNIRINSEHQVTDWLLLGENLSVTHTDGQGADNTSPYTGAIISAIFYPPHITPRDADGKYSGLPIQYSGTYGDVINPVAYLERIDVKRPALSVLVNPYAEIRLMEGLVFRSNYGITRNMDTYKEFRPRVPEIGKIFANNSLEMRNGHKTDFLAEQTLTFNRTFGEDHDINALAGYTYQHYRSEAFFAYTENFQLEDPEYRYFVNATDKTNMDLDGGLDESKMISYLGRINYSYKSKYLLSGILRRDGSSLLPVTHRWEVYPSLSAGWRISEENFFQVPWISELKLRASTGKLGNLSSLPTKAYNAPLTSTNSMMGQNPTTVTGYAENAITNSNLKWGIDKQTNVGVDASFLDSRISLEADYFVKKHERMIYQRPVPGTLGVGNNGPYVNLPGTVVDQGIELGLTVGSGTNSVIGYTINATYTRLRNEVESLEGDLTINQGSAARINAQPGRIASGQPLYSYYLYQSDGLFQTQEEINAYTGADGNLIQPNAQPGDLKFIDRDGDGTIDPDDRYFAGSVYPKFSYGLSASLTYKNFDLNVFLQGVHGNKLLNALKFTGLNASSGQGYNMLRDIKDAWSPSNTDSNIPRISYLDANGNFGTISDWYLENGSFARLRNFTLGYTIPASLQEKVQLSSLRIFFTAQNLFTLTKYRGSDPEIGLGEFGMDYGRYPQARVLMFGINVGL